MKTLEENKPDINELRRILEIRNKENLFSVQMGIQGTVIEEGYAETELVIEPKHLNLNHSVHGGCPATCVHWIALSSGIDRISSR